MIKTKILIAGIGGVGGYFGGWLARHYRDHPQVEIHFLARGRHLQKIQAEGLRVVHGADSFVARPSSATDNPATVGQADMVILACNRYDLEGMMDTIRPCVGAHTVLLPLLNGVESTAKISAFFPNNPVMEGCV